MLASALPANHKPATILAVVAHPDDEVLGCGGSLARWAAEGHPVHVLIAADGETARPGVSVAAVGRKQAAVAAAAALGLQGGTSFLDLPDNRLDSIDLLDLVRKIEEHVVRVQPFRVLTHHAGDVNIDHTLVHRAVLAAARPVAGQCVRELLFFETPSSTEWQTPGRGSPFMPSVHVDISGYMERKMAALQAYADELRPFPHPRSPQAIQALATWRGACAGIIAAEAFMLGRLVI
jgi:LmbE family N-acetylglucosaminyl deacetylase